jgi:hypothetical protein
VAQAHDDVLYSIRDVAQHEHLPEESLAVLVTKARDYCDLLSRRGDLSWEYVEYHTIVDLRDPLMEGRAVKLRVHLERLLEPVVVDHAGQKHLATRMTFRDLDGADHVDTLFTINTPLIRELDHLKQEHHVFDVLATVCLMPSPSGEHFRLLVHAMRPSHTPLQMIQATRAEIDQVEALLATLAQTKSSIFDYIYNALVRGLGLQGLEEASELSDSLEAVIVQACSDGEVGNASGKLHTLVIGAPAVGKKLLTEAARVLNPVFHEAHPSKATVAGVCSTAYQERGVWCSKPGYLPLAHRGVFAIQDFHAVKDMQREKLFGVFQMVMEDGRAIDATAARQQHPALTSIHLDMNKRSDLFPDSQLRGDTIIAKRLDDIRVPMTMLSRFDFIIDIPRDTQRQIEVALAMYDQPGLIVGPVRPGQNPAAWARELQVLVAFLRTKHENVRFPPTIRDGMQRKHAEFGQENEALFGQHPWLSDFQTRLVNSAFKFAAAYARMNNRPEPLAEDIDSTFRLIRRKFEFLATLARTLQIPQTWELPQRDEVAQWLTTRFAGQQMRTGDILQTYEDDFGQKLVRRTLERHLKDVAQHPKKGLWSFPP